MNTQSLATAARKPFAQSAWFDEAWLAAKQFAKGEYDGPAAVLLDVTLGMVPLLGQAIDARDILLGLNDVADQPDHHDAWFNLITALIGVVPGGGDAIKRALRSVKLGHAPAGELLSMLRALGRGNPEQAVLGMLDVSKLQPYIKTLTETLKNNRLLEALDAATRQRVLSTAHRLQTGLHKQFSKFADEVRGWLKRQPNNAAEADYISKTVPKKADKPNAKGGVATQAKEHASIAHVNRQNFFQSAVAELTQKRLFFKGILGEHMADYWVLEQGWVSGWQAHDRGMDGRWSNPDPKAARKLNDGGAMTPLWPLIPRGRGIDALWRTNGKNGKPYAVIEAKAYTNPLTPLQDMLADTHDKQEYEDFKQKLREWRGKPAGGRGRGGKRGAKTAPPVQSGTPAPPSSKPERPDQKTMQMSHEWIKDRVTSTTKDPLAQRDLLRNAKIKLYTRHVLLFSVTEIFDHTTVVWKWLKHSQGLGLAPGDNEHASHKATRIFGDTEIEAEERRRNTVRTAKAGNAK